MTDRQINRLMMFRAVSDYLSGNAEAVKKINALVELADELKRRISAIEFATERHSSMMKGRTDTKYEAEDRLTDILKAVSAALYAYAQKKGDNETKAVASMREWQFRSLRDEEQIRHANVILRKCESAAADLEHYAVNAEMIEAFRNAISNYERSLLVRDATKADRTVTTGDIGAMFRDLGIFLVEQLDPVMRMLRSIEPHVYDGYKAVRVTQSLGIRYRKNGETTPEQVPEAPAETAA